MLNLVHPDAGEVRYFGMPLLGNEAQIKARIGYSTGTVSWYPRRTVRDIKNVTSRFYDTWDDAAYECYRSLFDIDEQKTPRELSEGMKVKCNLLFALSHHADVLVLDEPTSGLDPFSRDELLGLFERIKGDGVAILFSTHIISDIQRCADDLIYIQNGQVDAACTKWEFQSRFATPGQTLEDALLHLERDGLHA